MSYQLALDPLQNQPGHPGAGGRALVPLAPSSLGLPIAGPQVDHNPYLSTPAPQFSEAVISVADLVNYLRRRWWIGLLLGLPVAAAVFYILGMGANIYEAEAKLRLRLQNGNVFHFDGMAQQSVTELSAPQLVNNHL